MIEYYVELYRKLPSMTLFNDDTRWGNIIRYRNLTNFKVLTYLDIVEDHSYVANFINYHKKVIIYPFIFSDVFLGFGLRSIDDKGFHIIPKYPVCLYSSKRTIDHFSKGSPVPPNSTFIFSEGVLDAEFFALFHPFSFAYLKAKIDSYQVQLISLLTKNVIICPDNDKAGKTSIQYMRESFRRYGVNIKVINLPNGYKDPGEILMYLLKEEKNAYMVKECIEQEVYNLVQGARSYDGKCRRV